MTPRLLCCGLALLLTIQTADAIPAFARKYDMSCTTCHAPFPRLKPYGEEFAGNGFRLADKESPRFFRNTGDDELSLMREVPLALRLEGYGRWRPQSSGRTDFQTPYLLKIISGGIIAPDIAYYFYFFFSERGEVAGIEDAYIFFNELFGTELDLAAGQFQVSDPLFKRELRLTLEDYQAYRVRPGSSGINLTYDRGVMLTYGFATGTDLTAEVLNGNGIGPADPGRNFDADRYKNVFVRVSQDVHEAVRIGAFGYFGKESDGPAVNTVQMLGPDLTIGAGPAELNVQYLHRADDWEDNSGLTPPAPSFSTRAAFAELIYTPEGERSRVVGVLLYNWIEGNEGTGRYHALTGHVSYLPSRNLRLLGEYTYDFTARAHMLSVGIVSAF
jgi:hypothetical protein